jgi:molybdopterin-biosynthesis enzyme MoeA-like protein
VRVTVLPTGTIVPSSGVWLITVPGVPSQLTDLVTHGGEPSPVHRSRLRSAVSGQRSAQHPTDDELCPPVTASHRR